MTHPENIALAIAPYGPRLPLPQLVTALNRIYHGFEAPAYERRHPEIYRQLPTIWAEMIATARGKFGDRPLRVLNVGCGTGFEAEQLLRMLPAGQVTTLVCYDPSPVMLERCRARIGALYPETIFCAEPQELPDGPYDLLATNSLLHHLPHPLALIGALLPRLGRDAVWLAGHEPSRRFYTNPVCQLTYATFTREAHWRKFLDGSRLADALGRRLGLRCDPPRQTALAAVRVGLFARRPPAYLVDRLVDYNVAHSVAEADQGRGFDIAEWRGQLERIWECVYLRSYGYVELAYEQELPVKWRRIVQTLADRFPADGASFSSVWRRRP